MYCFITRPQEEAMALAAELAEYGIISFIEPLIEIKQPLIEQVTEIDKFIVVAISSSNAIAALAKLTPNRHIKLAVVGTATAKKASFLGFKNIITAAGNADSLIELIKTNFTPGEGKILFPCGDYVANDLEQSLSQFGYKVEKLIVYNSIAVKSFSDNLINLLKEEQIKAGLFFSARTATTFTSLIRKYKLESNLIKVKAFALSENIATLLKQLEWQQITIAENKQAMIDLIVRDYNE